MQLIENARHRRRRAGGAIGIGAALALLAGLAVPLGLDADPATAMQPVDSQAVEAPEGTPESQSGQAEEAGSNNLASSAAAGSAQDESMSQSDSLQTDSQPASDGEPLEDDPSSSTGNTSGTKAPVAASPETQSNPTAAPRTVPAAPAGSAVISVRVGGDRATNGAVSGLAGVKLGLYAAGTATNGGGTSTWPTQGTPGGRVNEAWSWTTCISDVDGDCNFVIPIRSGTASATGTPQDTRFWVIQESGPTGWYSNPVLRVGSYKATPEGTWQYRFRTDTQLRAGATYRSTTSMPWDEVSGSGATSAGNPDRFFMRNRIDSNAEGWSAANVGRTTGVWNQSRNNPAFVGECGIDIALIADTSGSLGATGISDLKSSMTSFVNSFRGTNTRMSLFSFSDISPGSIAGNYPTLMPVTTAAQGALFSSQYASWVAGGGTNWDRGFAAAANSAETYDLAILLTDGNPTVIRDDLVPGASAFNSLQDIDAGIFSANQLKAKGTRIVALGVGQEFTSASDYNLRAVSGPVSGSDYYRAADFAAATDALVGLANAHCNGTIGVQKMIVPAGGTIADATAAPAGWQFTASGTAAAATVQAPTTRTTTTGGDGKVEFGVAFTAPAASGPVQVLETQQSGYELLPVGTGSNARNAVCLNAATGAAVPVTNAGTAAQPGIVVQATRAQRVECKVYNRVLPPGKLEVEKHSTPATGATVQPGENVTYTLTFRNVGGVAVAVNHDDVLTDVLDDATIAGSVTAQSPLQAALTPTGERIRVTGSLAPGTERTVTYTVTVRDPIPSTANGVLRNVVVPSGEQPPTGCTPGAPCTEHPVRGSLTWNKVDGTSQLLGGSAWALTPLGTNGQPQQGSALAIVDCVAGSVAECAGADRDPAAGKFAVTGLTIGRYELRETKAPAGFILLASPITVTVNTNVAFGDIVNSQIEVPPLPLTGGTGSLGFALAAGGLGAATAGALWWQRRRNEKRR